MSRGAVGPGSLSWTVAWRFLRGHRSRLLDGTARAALAATALGVMALVIAMALMTGYQEDLQTKLIGDHAAVGIYPRAGVEIDADGLAALRALPGVQSVVRVSYGQGQLAASGGPSAGVTLRGVDLASLPFEDVASVSIPEEPSRGMAGAASLPLDRLRRPEGEPPGVILGTELARTLGVGEGDPVRLTALGLGGRRPRFRYRSLVVVGTFTTGFSEFDRSWSVLSREVVDAVSGRRGAEADHRAAGPYEVAVDRPGRAAAIASSAQSLLGEDYLVTDWRDLNRELFAALRLQKLALFGALGLIIVVSTFNVASTMVVLVRERMRDIGALGAMGMAPAGLRRIFLWYGTFLGLVGTGIGVALGWGICWVLTTFRIIRFEPEVAAIYFIDSVPFRTRPSDLALIVAFALLWTFLACLRPAWRAARTQPSAALRYE